MGRGRVELKRIENKINRQVTFSKRRSGLLKKAREISVLCDADVALIVFSTKGKLCEFTSSSSCMGKILERYEHYSHAEKHLIPHNIDSHGSMALANAKLKAKLEVLQKRQRHYMGEELDSLSTKELQNVEHQLDISLKHIRSKKNQLMYESISELEKKDKALEEYNNNLSKKEEKQKEKEKEKEENAITQHQTEYEQLKYDLNSSPVCVFEPLPSLNMRVAEEETAQMEDRGQNGSLMPQWMLSHIGNQ